MNESIRVGTGLDFHRLAPGESLIIGGVRYDYHLGTIAHSDGDVLVHAICDAILGAAAMGDIGTNFPDDDPSFKDISSIELLKRVMTRVVNGGYTVLNVDSTVMLQSPSIGPNREEMVENISAVVDAPVNLKATTTESMGFIGEEKGIGAQAVAALRSLDEG